MTQVPADAADLTTVLDDAASRRHVIFHRGQKDGARICIYARGGCDMPALFGCVPLIQQVLDGTCCIVHEGEIADSRSDILLQSRRVADAAVAELLVERLRLARHYFEPVFFEPTITVRARDEDLTFEKNVVIVSTGPDLIRSAYRHKETGLLVDPGGIWLGKPMDKVLADPSAARWFKEHFESVGKISLEEFARNFRQLISYWQNRGAHVLVLNMLIPESRVLTHTYQFVKDPLVIRRREFNLALVDLSRELGFSIVDVDRALQREGIQGMADWAHPHAGQHFAITQELVRILRDRGVF